MDGVAVSNVGGSTVEVSERRFAIGSFVTPLAGFLDAAFAEVFFFAGADLPAADFPAATGLLAAACFFANAFLEVTPGFAAVLGADTASFFAAFFAGGSAFFFAGVGSGMAAASPSAFFFAAQRSLCASATLARPASVMPPVRLATDIELELRALGWVDSLSSKD